MSVARLLLVNALIRVAAAASGQLFAFLLADRLAARAGTGATLVGAFAACFFATELIGAPIAGRRADVLGQRRVLRFGPVFGALAGLAGGLAALTSPGLAGLAIVLVVARTTEGASAACAVPATLVLLSRATEGDAARRSRVMGLFEITSLLAMLAGYAVAGAAWDARAGQAFFVVPLLYAAAWLVAFGERERTAQEPLESQRSSGLGFSVPKLALLLVRAPGSLGFGVAWLAANAVAGAWMQQAPYLLKLPVRSPAQSLVGGFSGTDIGVAFGVWGLAFLLGIALWSWLGARVPRPCVLGAALLAMLGVAGALALANHGAGRWALFVAIAFVLVESGFTPAALAHLADVTGRHDTSRGAALGLYSLLLGGGQLLGSALGGAFAARWQMDGLLALTALLAGVALAGVTSMRSARRTRGNEVARRGEEAR